MKNLNNYLNKLKEIWKEDVDKEEDNRQWISLKIKTKINNNKLFKIKLNNKYKQ